MESIYFVEISPPQSTQITPPTTTTTTQRDESNQKSTRFVDYRHHHHHHYSQATPQTTPPLPLFTLSCARALAFVRLTKTVVACFLLFVEGGHTIANYTENISARNWFIRAIHSILAVCWRCVRRCLASQGGCMLKAWCVKTSPAAAAATLCRIFCLCVNRVCVFLCMCVFCVHRCESCTKSFKTVNRDTGVYPDVSMMTVFIP